MQPKSTAQPSVSRTTSPTQPEGPSDTASVRGPGRTRASRLAHAGTWLLGVVIVWSLLAGLGLRDPVPPDEPRFALAARDMVHGGQWLLPHRGTELYAEKPPMFMWLQAVAYALLGNLRIAFLLPSLLAALATLALVRDLGKRLWNPRVGNYAAAALFACLQFGLQAKRGQIDMVLVAMTTFSLWALLRHLLLGPRRDLLWLGAFAAGVGTVTKGVGFLPLLVLLPWLALRVGGQATLRPRPGEAVRWLAAMLFFIAGTATWLLPLLLAVMASDDPALGHYARELLFKQTGERYGAPWHHVQPAWYYLQSMATVWLPGVLLLPWLLPAWWRRLRQRDARLWLLLGWSVLVLLFFSASPGKREVYIFPVLPALCLAAAPLLPGLLRRRGVRRGLVAYLGALAVAAAWLGFSVFADADWLSRVTQDRGLTPAALHQVASWLLVLSVMLVPLLAWARRGHKLGAAVVLATGMVWTVYGLALMPAISPESSASTLMQRVATRIGPDAALGMVAWREQHLLQSTVPTVDFGFRQPWHVQWAAASAWARQDPTRRWLFVEDIALSPCVSPAAVVDVGRSNRRRWLLVPGSAVRQGCTTPPFDGAAGQKEIPTRPSHTFSRTLPPPAMSMRLSS